ncbi:hypothetical protein BGHDH14_bgh03790 [Blumeria hordei DH14]|uniref:Uncharacterized protein n=1 Tax=Blumeria graminis f. sp. hordei (strain DH14) TaxID=546991 RepID=N1JEX8_BLUG1|nr:hypothetical protein BGHDH14_bgh03790 [Blumeria hordei DH14]
MEILVHTPAPSSAKDDLRWRNCADAYMEFTPASRRRIAVHEGLASVSSSSDISRIPATQQSHNSPELVSETPDRFGQGLESNSPLIPEPQVDSECKLSSNSRELREAPHPTSGTALPRPAGTESRRSGAGFQTLSPPRRLRQGNLSVQPETPQSANKRLDATIRRQHFSRKAAFKSPSRIIKPTHLHEACSGFLGSATDPIPSMHSHRTNQAHWLQMLEIRAPAPTTGNLQLTPELLTTPALRDLMQLSDSSRYFDADLQTRALEPLERGYWHVDCRSWHPTRQAQCWQSLAAFIVRDRLAGWGVAGVRDAAWTTIRVYCWGALVAPIYLLLSQASEGDIHATGARWIGGDGSTVVRVNATSKQTP